MSVSRKGALLASAAAFLAFLPSLTHGWTNYDDPMFLLGETGWRGLGAAQWVWAFTSKVGSVYQPLAWLSCGLDYTLWGLDARGYHLQSVLWHALSAGMMFLLARRLLSAARPPREGEPAWGLDAASLLSALAFAVHPLRVESVSWASERRDVMGCAFVLAAALAYLRARETGRPPRSLAPVFVLFLLSLFSKGMALLLPVALLALDFYPLRRIGPRGEGLLEAVKEKLPLLALSFAFGLAGIAAQERIRWTWEQHGLPARLAQACYALIFYVRKTLWPSGLMPLYELRPPMNPYEPRFLLSAAAVAAAAGLCWRLRRRRPWLAASAFWYAVLLFPVSGLFQFGPQLVADRYSYITTLPLAVLAGAALREGLRRRRALSLAAAFAVVASLAAACVRQQSFWSDSEALWARVLSGDPACAMAHGSVGVLRASAGRLAEAEDHFRRALAAFPGCVEDQDRLAALLTRGGGPPGEERRLRVSVETHPVCRKARANLGAVRAQAGDLQGAVEILSVIALLDPEDLGARRNLERARAGLAARR
ncbi:MAG: tetratricopeptide repeat protein [Elusimicrobia bacterium]|nr:tetratricopeptide repeat protein [Elusimicrobiota bacterium]